MIAVLLSTVAQSSSEESFFFFIQGVSVRGPRKSSGNHKDGPDCCGTDDFHRQKKMTRCKLLTVNCNLLLIMILHAKRSQTALQK